MSRSEGGGGGLGVSPAALLTLCPLPFLVMLATAGLRRHYRALWLDFSVKQSEHRFLSEFLKLT